MKFRLLLFIGLVTLPAQAQVTTRTFLVYERINGQAIDDSKAEMLEELTLFMMKGILTQTDTKTFTRDFNILSNKDERKIYWDLNTTGENIEIRNRTRQMKGRILSDPFVDSALFVNHEIEFLLLPIGFGISIERLKGRYVTMGLNQNDTINFGNIIKRGRYKGFQETSFTSKFDSASKINYRLTKYSNSKYNNLIYLGYVMNHFVQPVSVDSETVITFNLFPAQFEQPNRTIKSLIKLRYLQ